MPSQADLEFTVKMQDQTTAVLRSMDSGFSALTQTLKAQTAAMQQLMSAMGGTISAHRQSAEASLAHKSGLDAVSNSLKELTQKHEEAKEGAEKEEVSLRKLVGTAKEAAEAFSAIWGSSEIIEMTIGKWSEAEVAITRLGHTMNSTKAEAHEMYEAMDDIATVSLGSTTEQLVGIARAATELGLSAEKTKEFAKNVAMLATVTGVSADRISDSMIQVLTSTNEVETGIHSFAESFAVMQRQTAGGSDALMNMALSLSRMTAGTKVSSLEILGVSSAMSHLGVNTRFAGSSIEQALQTFQQLANDTKLAPQLDLMAHSMGLMPEQFKEIEKNDPTQIFIKFLGAINDITAKGGDVHKFLSDFGMGGQQTQTVFEAAAKRVDLFTKAIKDAQDAGQSSVLEKMFGDLGKTIVGQIDSIEKSFGTIMEKLGGALGPSVKNILAAVQGVLDIISLVENALPPFGLQIAAAFIVGLPAALAIQKAFTFLTEVVLTGAGTFRKLGGILGDLTRIFTIFRSAEKDVADEAKTVEAGLKGVAEKEGLVADEAVGAEAGVKKVSTAMKEEAGVMVKLIDLLGSFFKAWLVLDAIDPEDKFGAWIDKNVPGASAIDNAFSKIGMGRSYKQQEETQKGFDAEAAPKKEEGEKKEGEKKEEGNAEEARAPADKGERQSSANDNAITAQYKGDLQAIMDLEKKRATINSQLLSVEKLIDAPDDLLKKFDLTRNMVQSQSDLLKLQQAQLDPLYQQGIAWEQAMESAGAYTKAEQDAADTANKVFEAVQKAKEALTDQGKAALTTQMQEDAVKAQTRDTSAKRELEAMMRTLSTSYSLNQADKDRLEIDNQIVSLWETHDYTKDQLDHMRQLLTLTKQVQEQSAQFSELNPQAKAIQDYEDQLKTLQQRFPQGGDEFNREKTRLDQSTLAARSPIGNLAQQQADEIKQLGIAGKYREADLKTLQEITELERQGVLDESEKSKQIEAQIGDNNRRIQDIKDMQSELDSLTQSFGSGLSGAIQGALAGQKYAFQKFLASLGGKMMDMAFSQFAKELEPGVNGLLGSFFGTAKTGTDKLTKLAEDQAKQTEKTAAPWVQQMLVNAQNVVIQANTIAGLKNGDSQNAGVNTSSQIPSIPVPKLPPATPSATPEATPEASPVPKGTVSVSGPSEAKPGSITSTGDMDHPINWDALDKTVKKAHEAVNNVVPFPKPKPVAAPVGEVTKSELPPTSGGSNPYGSLPNPFSAGSGTEKYMGTPFAVPKSAMEAIRKATNQDMNKPYSGDFTDPNAARAYLHETSIGSALGRPDDTAKLNPTYAINLANTIKEARSKGLQASIFSGARPPFATAAQHSSASAFDQGGYSLHPVGMATDIHLPDFRRDSPQYAEFQKIAASHGVYNPYGISDPREFNHFQAIYDKAINPNGPLRQFYSDGHQSPEREQEMWNTEGKLYPSLRSRTVSAKPETPTPPIPPIRPEPDTSALLALGRKQQEDYEKALKSGTVDRLSPDAANDSLARPPVDPTPGQIDRLSPDALRDALARPANDNGSGFKVTQASVNSASQSLSAYGDLNGGRGGLRYQISKGDILGDQEVKDALRQHALTNPGPVPPLSSKSNVVDFQGLQKSVDTAANSITTLGKASGDASQKLDDGSKAAPPSSGGSAPTVPTTDSNGDAGSNSGSQLANGVEGLGQQALGHIPGAAPIMQGFNLLKSLFGSLFGGSGGAAGAAGGAGGGGGLLGGLFSGLFGLLHSGGLVGPGMTTTFRSVNPAIFNTARRFHDGLGDDEFPAILQKGERVLTASQDARNTNAMNRLANAVANQSTPAGTVAPVVPGTTNHFSMVVNTPDAPSFRRSSSQIMAIQAAAGARANSKHN